MTYIRPIKVKFSEWLLNLIDAFFIYNSEQPSRILNTIWMIVLYLLGILHWCIFLNWGDVPFDLHDWTQAGAYLSFLRNAYRANMIPLQIDSTLSPNRYLAIPHTLISPQSYLLRYLEPGLFILANFLILFTVGYIGLILLRKRYSLAPAAFSVLVLLFNFNGHITAHYAVGHIEWTGYFFLPFFFLLLLKVIEGQPADWKWVLLISITFFWMSLQGSYHFVLWCFIFLLIWGLFSPKKHLIPAIKAILFSMLLCLFRFLPPAIEFLGGGKSFFSGFPTVTDLVSGLIVLKYPSEALSWGKTAVGWWEVDTFIGLIGLFLIIYFGIYQTSRTGYPTNTLMIPIALMTFLSIGQIYSVINHLPIPLLDSERVSSRFIILPLVVLIILTSANLQVFLNRLGKRNIAERILFLALLILLLHDLIQHSRFWSVKHMYDIFPSTPVNINAMVTYIPDPLYFRALLIGAAGTMLTFFSLIFLAFYKRHKINQTSH